MYLAVAFMDLKSPYMLCVTPHRILELECIYKADLIPYIMSKIEEREEKYKEIRGMAFAANVSL